MPEVMFGPYRLVQLLGRGGMGEVWRAVDTSHDDRIVALKLLGSWLGDDPAYAHSFRRESAMAAQLGSPHVVPIHRYGEIDGRLYLDMQFVDGTDLGSLLRRGALPVPRAVDLVTQAARGLAAAHESGLVHRDVKPSNILLTSVGGEDHVYVIDFGIARRLESATVSNTVLGTVAYMAPERFDGRGDHRADVYALGAVLFESLTGRPPFTADNALAVIYNHQRTPPPRPSGARPELSAEVDQVVVRAMAKQPEQRHPTAAAFATENLVRVWDLATGTQRGQPLTGFTNSVNAITITRLDGRPVVVAGSSDQTVRIWDLATGAPIGPPLSGPTSIFAVTTGQLGDRPVIVTGGSDGSIQVWDPRTSTKIGQPFTGHTDSVSAVTVAQRDGRPVVISAGYDSTLRIWDLATGTPVGQPLAGHSDAVYTVTTAELDGRTVIVSGSNDSTVRVWDLATGAPVGRPFTGHTDGVSGLAIADLNGRPVVVTASFDDTARIFDLATGAQLGRPITGHTGNLNAVAVTRLEGRDIIVTSSNDDTSRTWDLAVAAAS